MKAKIHVKLENGEALDFTKEVLLIGVDGFGLDELDRATNIGVKEILIKPIWGDEVVLDAHKLYVEG